MRNHLLQQIGPARDNWGDYECPVSVRLADLLALPSGLASYKSGLPYWLYQPIREQLLGKPYSPSLLERREARQYLIRHGEPASASAVRQLLDMWTASDTWKLEHSPWNRRRPK